MMNKHGHKIALFVEIILTLFIIGMMMANSFDNVLHEVEQYESGLASDYQRLLDAYVTDFQMMVNDAKVQIEADVSFEEMEAYLQSMDENYERAIGTDIYDGFALTYKGKYAKSWNYGDYTDYDPNTRPWYQEAQKANGEIAITAPYVTFLREDELADDDEYIVLTITQKYNDEISFCYDIKTFGVNDLLSKRYSRYENTFAIMYDANGYIMSSTEPDLYCHNIRVSDQRVSEELVNAIVRGEKSRNKIDLNYANHQLQFCYLTTDEIGNGYLLVIPFAEVAQSAFLGTFVIAVLLIAMEIWIYLRTEKQKKMELELEKVKNISQMKQDFLARMSHDMRTPMNGILGLAELSEQENNPSVLKENIAKIHKSGEYLLGLINDTLDIQKMESGNLSLNPKAVSMQELIASAVDMIRLPAKNKEIKLIIKNKSSGSDLYIKTDPMRMKQIFVNLLSNAIKFTPEGGNVILGFEVLGRHENIVRYRITVTDTGTGMSREFVKKSLFKPFSQEHNELTDNDTGTGLGLSIVKKLIDMMGGTITVETELGQGTRFTIDMDLECAENPENPTVSSYIANGQGESVDFDGLQGKRVLLAEDHPLNAEIAMRILEKAGCVITWTQNGQECVDVFSNSRQDAFDVILMDIRMPVKDGLEAASNIRNLSRADAGKIPIIAMSANAYDEDIQKSLNAGMNAHLAKPVSAALLYAALNKYCK